MSRLTLKLHIKWKIWGGIFEQEMGWYAMRRDIHCYWTGAYSPLDVEGRWKELLSASTKFVMGQRPAISVMVDSQIAHKIPYFRHSVCKRNWMLCYGERYILMLKWPIASLRCTSNVGGASESIYKTFDVHIVLFSLTSTLKLHTKYQIWGSISARERGWYTIRRGIHCC